MCWPIAVVLTQVFEMQCEVDCLLSSGMKLYIFAAVHQTYTWPLEKGLRDLTLLCGHLGVGTAGNQEMRTLFFYQSFVSCKQQAASTCLCPVSESFGRSMSYVFLKASPLLPSVLVQDP